VDCRSSHLGRIPRGAFEPPVKAHRWIQFCANQYSSQPLILRFTFITSSSSLSKWPFFKKFFPSKILYGFLVSSFEIRARFVVVSLIWQA
jgi:hypothetical protein